jgi:RNA polymerase primary sigma factor
MIIFLPRLSAMRTPEFLDADGPRRWFLDAPEAEVMSAARERELLLELADCRRIILRATRRPDGSEWDLTRPDAEFRRAVRGMAKDGRHPDRVTDHGAADGPSGDQRTASIPHLAHRYEEIRDMLAMANSRLVAYIARRYLNRGIAPADLIQEGFCGLLEAIDRFDPVNTTRLATYASWWIRQAFQRAIANGSYPVRLTPRQLRRLAQSLPRPAGSALPDVPALGLAPHPGAGRPRTAPEGAPHRDAASWSELAAIRPRISLDAASRIDDSVPLANLFAFAPEPDREAGESSESVDSLLTALTPREQFILKLRFGLDGQPRHSLSQIGAILAVSKERVRQIQERALDKLREAAGDLGLCDAATASPRHAAGDLPDIAAEAAGLG